MRNERIRQRRKELKLTQLEVAKSVGVSKTSVSQWESGDTAPRGENLYALCKILKCEPDWLLFGKEKNAPQPDTDTEPLVRKGLPLISWQQATDWSSSNRFAGKESFSCPVTCSEHSFVLRVQGISMEPVFRESDLIFVDPDVKPAHGSYVVVRQNKQNGVMLKQLIQEGGERYLKSVNPNWPAQIIPLSSITATIGVVIFAGRSFK